jgi:hypothetical protein
VTPRPSVGKKKAKLMAFTDSCRGGAAAGHKTSSNHAAVALACAKKVELDSRSAARNARNDSLTRLAAAAEAKNVLVQEQLMFQLFMQDPNSAQSKAYFVAMGERYTLHRQQRQLSATALPTTSTTAVLAGAGAYEEEDDETTAVDLDSPILLQVNHRHAEERRCSTSTNDGGEQEFSPPRRFSCDADNAPDDNEDHVYDQSFPTLPATQRLVALLERDYTATNKTVNEEEDDEDDTQLTTLSK